MFSSNVTIGLRVVFSAKCILGIHPDLSLVLRAKMDWQGFDYCKVQTWLKSRREAHKGKNLKNSRESSKPRDKAKWKFYCSDTGFTSGLPNVNWCYLYLKFVLSHVPLILMLFGHERPQLIWNPPYNPFIDLPFGCGTSIWIESHLIPLFCISFQWSNPQIKWNLVAGTNSSELIANLSDFIVLYLSLWSIKV